MSFQRRKTEERTFGGRNYGSAFRWQRSIWQRFHLRINNCCLKWLVWSIWEDNVHQWPSSCIYSCVFFFLTVKDVRPSLCVSRLVPFPVRSKAGHPQGPGDSQEISFLRLDPKSRTLVNCVGRKPINQPDWPWGLSCIYILKMAKLSCKSLVIPWSMFWALWRHFRKRCHFLFKIYLVEEDLDSTLHVLCILV